MITMETKMELTADEEEAPQLSSEEAPDDAPPLPSAESQSTAIANQQVQKVLLKYLFILATLSTAIAIASLSGLIVASTCDYSDDVYWTRKASNIGGLALWGLVLFLAAIFVLQQQQQPNTTCLLFLAHMRNLAIGLVLPVSILTGVALALGSLSSCGQGWVFFFFFYHAIGLVGAIWSLVVWFRLPGVVRRCMNFNDDDDNNEWTKSRHLHPIRKWVVASTIVMTLVIPWPGLWITGAALNRNKINESLYPDATTSPYRLPFEAGVRTFVGQGNQGSFSHNNWNNYYAFDFLAACGTTVVAARGGKVVSVVDQYQGSYLTGNGNNNYISIYHEQDDTYSEYHHLLQDSAMVELGDVVLQGKPIARVGNTGQSSMPHLHFVVERGCCSFGTMPISFQDVTRNAGIPRSFRVYTSDNDSPGVGRR